MNGFLPRSTRYVGSRFVGRGGRSPGAAYSKTPLSQAAKSVTSAEIFKRVIGKKSYVPEKYAKEVKSLAAHASQARTEAERKFLRTYYERRGLKHGEIKKALRGAYEVSEERGFAKKFESGTMTERVARVEKAIMKEHTPPPAKVDTGAERLKVLRTIQAQAHAPYSSRDQAAPTMQEPTPLPATSASGWSAPAKTAAPSSEQTGSLSKTSYPNSFVPGFTGGYASARLGQARPGTAEPKKVVPPETPSLGPAHGVFSGGRLTQSFHDRPEQPFSAAPAKGGADEPISPSVSAEPVLPPTVAKENIPPPPPPSESPSSDIGELPA